RPRRRGRSRPAGRSGRGGLPAAWCVHSPPRAPWHRPGSPAGASAPLPLCATSPRVVSLVILSRPSRYDPGVITDRQPVGWGRAVFLSMTLFVLLFVLEGLVAAIALMFGVAMILPVCFELAFANRRREWAAFGAARARRWISSIAIFIPAAIVIGAVAIAITSALHLTGTNDLGAD